MVAAVNLGRALMKRWGVWNASVAAGVAYAALVVIAWLVMPAIDEVPAAFPASLLWSFRLNALTIQILLWTALALSFGELTMRSLKPRLSQSATAARAN